MRFFIALLALVPLLTQGQIAKFPSISVSVTNYANALVATNSATIMNWPVVTPVTNWFGSAHGGVAIGQTPFSWGGSPTSGMSFLSVRDTSLGDPHYNGLYLAVTTNGVFDSGWDAGFDVGAVTAGTDVFIRQSPSGGTTDEIIWVAGISPDGTTFEKYIHGTNTETVLYWSDQLLSTAASIASNTNYANVLSVTNSLLVNSGLTPYGADGVSPVWIRTAQQNDYAVITTCDAQTNTFGWTSLYQDTYSVGAQYDNAGYVFFTFNTTDTTITAKGSGTPTIVADIVLGTAGLKSTATDAAISGTSAGWTNTFGKAAVIRFDGSALIYNMFNNALTSIYTNTVSVGHGTEVIQTSGKILFTSGTVSQWVAAPF